jgi:2-polyprenyl-3-methyl-5-hydroxy-6-metoxy-1,4-benzoquinol methylase
MNNSPKIDLTKRISEEDFLKSEIEMGIGFHNPDFINLCEFTSQQFNEFDIKTVLDFGSGTGVYAESYRKNGYDVWAYEIWEPHRVYIRQNAPQVKITDTPITTDLLNFIETSEHMTDLEIINLFKKISPKYVLFSSTSDKTEWDFAWGHINVKEQDEWVNMFNGFGYKLLKEMKYPTEYTKLFIKL